jgi:FKBP-type peptidyl-prolyl cis-trans isomerase
MKAIYTILAASVLFVSCNQYQKTKSGLLYKISHGSGKEKLKVGQIAIINLEFKAGPKDSILFSTAGHIPTAAMVDTSAQSKYNFPELLPLCSVGDKIDFALSTDTLRKLGANFPDNPVFAPKSYIKGKVEILKVLNKQEDVQQYMEQEADKEKDKEIKDIEEYLKKKNIKAEKTVGGTYVQVDSTGVGDKADSGKQVSIYYTGTLLSTGKEFDSNIKNGVKQQPYTFVVGRRQSIPGMEEGIKYFAKGGKGKLYIPAMQAYGQRGNPPVMPAYANLVFDIEVADVTIPPPAPVAPQAPMMPPHGISPRGIPPHAAPHQPMHK